MAKRTLRKIVIAPEMSVESFLIFSEHLGLLEDESNSDIEIELTSDGGSAHSALAYCGRMRLSNCKLTVTLYGIAASAAVLILAAADHRRMTREAWVMVHEDSGKLKGAVVDLEREAAHLRRLETQWALLLKEHTGTAAAIWTKLHKQTTYLDASDCLKLGLIDEII